MSAAVTEAVRAAIDSLPEAAWDPAVESDHNGTGGLRKGAWVAELTRLVDLSA